MRTMIVLSDHHHAEAKRKAANNGISLSEYIRQLIARDLSTEMQPCDPSRVFSLFDSGGSRIADGKRGAVSEAMNKLYTAKGL